MMGKKMANSSKSSRTSVGSSSMPAPRAVQKVTAAVAGGSASPGPSSSDAPVAIPHIKIQDSFKQLPRYSAALSRPHDDIMLPEDLDAIQLELEMLLITVAQRSQVLKVEYEMLDKEEKREKKGKYIEKQPASPPNKRKRGASGSTFADEKKFKGKYFGSQMSKSKLKNARSPAPSHHTDDSMDATPYLKSTHIVRQNPKIVVPKNDTPHKFWLSVEPYCMPISHEDIKLLDDLIEEYSGLMLPPIPELGPHYSTQWAADELKDEQDNSNPNAKTNKRFTSNSSADVMNMLKKGEKLMGENVTGPLTQRLMAAFLEENVMGDSNDGGPMDTPNDENENSNENNRSMLNGIEIEKRVKKELIELGILDQEDFGKESDDEVLSEIKRVQTELSAISNYNFEELKKLHRAAKDEMDRLEVKRQLDVTDQQIVEMYKKIEAIRKKDLPLSEQESADVFRLIDEQNRLADLLDSMPVPGPSFKD